MVDTHAKSLIHGAFIQQLEASGQWEWAIYVALNTRDRARSEKLVRDILCRNFASSQTRNAEFEKKLKFITKELHVPESVSCFHVHVHPFPHSVGSQYLVGVVGLVDKESL